MNNNQRVDCARQAILRLIEEDMHREVIECAAVDFGWRAEEDDVEAIEELIGDAVVTIKFPGWD